MSDKKNTDFLDICKEVLATMDDEMTKTAKQIVDCEVHFKALDTVEDIDERMRQKEMLAAEVKQDVQRAEALNRTKSEEWTKLLEDISERNKLEDTMADSMMGHSDLDQVSALIDNAFNRKCADLRRERRRTENKRAAASSGEKLATERVMPRSRKRRILI